MGIGAWIKKEYAEVRGNLKYDLYKYGFFAGLAVIIAAIAKWIQVLRHAPQQDFMGYSIMGALVFIALINCVALSTSHQRKIDGGDELPPNQIPGSLTAGPTNEVDLHGVIEQVHFGKDNNELYSYLVWMKLQITNRGTAEATITGWKLYSIVGEDSSEGDIADLSPNLAIKRTKYGMMDSTDYYEHMEPDLKVLAYRTPFKRGMPHDGWVQFAVNCYMCEPAVNAKLLIVMTDSLGGFHHAIREPQNYKRDGEIVERKPTSLLRPLLGGS